MVTREALLISALIRGGDCRLLKITVRNGVGKAKQLRSNQAQHQKPVSKFESAGCYG